MTGSRFAVLLVSGVLGVIAADERLPQDNLLVYRNAVGQVLPVRSVEDWNHRRDDILRGFAAVAGDLPGPEKRCALDLQVHEETDCGGYVRRSISYTSEPGCRVPALLLIPKSALAGSPVPAVLCLHPTDDRVGNGVVVGLGAGRYPAYGNELAERGFVVLAPSYPLLASYQPDLRALGWRSGALKAVWDNLRGIDLLESLPFVQRGGIGVIGHSLGGHNAIFTAIHDDRIRAVVSSCGFDSFVDYYGGRDDLWKPGQGWCQERYLPRLADFRGRLERSPFDFHELLGALAPRPILVVAPKRDDNFRADSVDRIAASAQAIYALHGVRGRLHVEHPDCGHDFPPENREQAFRFLKAALQPVRVGVFDVDASPPVGSPLAYDRTLMVETPLSCRGIVLVSADNPIVICALDWIGVGNEAHRVFREKLAAAAGTTSDRVIVHTLHQHDAPWCDFEIEDRLGEHGLGGQRFDSATARSVMDRAAAAVRRATAEMRSVTHLGVGRAPVERVASNRRILGADGKVRATRFTATKDAALRAEPEGLIDPELKLIAFFDGEQPVAAMTFFATHPQSYYRTGRANPDFPGLARNERQRRTGVPHLHLNGAGGNIGAGKYNDGAPENRAVLTRRMEAAMARAWESLRRSPLSAADVDWRTVAVALPPSRHLDEPRLLNVLADASRPIGERTAAAAGLTFLRRCRAGITTDLAALRLGDARILSFPGELFVEYQLAAQSMAPEQFVAVAANGDYGPGYIGTAVAYDQGGYETLPTSSFVSPEVERILLDATRSLLGAPARR